MSRILRLELDDGSVIGVEIDAGSARTRRGNEQRGIIETTNKTFNEVVEQLKPATRALLDCFKDLEGPEEIVLALGVKFSSSAGIILTSVASDATFHVTLKWKK